MAYEAARKFLVYLAGDPADQVVVVEKPFGGLLEPGVSGLDRGKVTPDVFEGERDRRRLEETGERSRRALEITLGCR